MPIYCLYLISYLSDILSREKNRHGTGSECYRKAGLGSLPILIAGLPRPTIVLYGPAVADKNTSLVLPATVTVGRPITVNEAQGRVMSGLDILADHYKI